MYDGPSLGVLKINLFNLYNEIVILIKIINLKMFTILYYDVYFI